MFKRQVIHFYHSAFDERSRTGAGNATDGADDRIQAQRRDIAFAALHARRDIRHARIPGKAQAAAADHGDLIDQISADGLQRHHIDLVFLDEDIPQLRAVDALMHERPQHIAVRQLAETRLIRRLEHTDRKLDIHLDRKERITAPLGMGISAPAALQPALATDLLHDAPFALR